MSFKKFLSVTLAAVLIFALAAAAQAAPQTVRAQSEFSPEFSKSAVAKARVKFDGVPSTMLLGNSYRVKASTSLASGLTFSLTTSNSAVLSLVQSGSYVYAVPVSTGKAKLTATIKYNGKNYKATKTIKVKMPPITAVYVESEASTTVGSSYTLHPSVSPSIVSGVKYAYSSSDKSVATVTANGAVKGIKEGTCVITVKAGGKKAQCNFTVHDDLTPAYKRAFLFGMSLDDSGYTEFEFDPLTSVYDEVVSVSSMLSNMGVTSNYFLNRTKANLLSEMDGWQLNTTKNDTTYIYYSGHGAVDNGQLLMIAGTDKAVSIKELKSKLDQINGKVVLFLNCCESGDAIGKSVSPEVFANAVVSTFASSNAKSGEMSGGKYTVICACKSTQSGWIIKGVDVFGDALTKALGWNLLGKYSTGNWLCDANSDGKATLTELSTYMRNDINKAIASDPEMYGIKQTLVCYPAKSADVLFAKP